MNIEFKTLEDGWMLRSFIQSIRFIFTNPIHILTIGLGFAFSFYGIDFMLMFLLFCAFSISYSHFYQEKNNSNLFLNKLFFKTLFNSFKQQRNFYLSLFATLFINFIYVIFLNSDNPASKEESELSTLGLIFSFLIIFAFFLIVYFFITTFFFKMSIFYYLLMKSNNIFYDFSYFDRNFHNYMSNYSYEISRKNKSFNLKLGLSSFAIFFGLLVLIIMSRYFIHPAIINLFLPLISFIIFGYCFFITKELIDGKKQDIKVKELKPVENI